MHSKIETVKESYGRCLVKGDFFGRFYDIFIPSHPLIQPLFANTDFEAQKHRLRHGLNCIIMFAGDQISGISCLNRLQKSHSKQHLNIPPELYPNWKESLLQTIREFDKELKIETLGAWSEIIDLGIEYIVSGYENTP